MKKYLPFILLGLGIVILLVAFFVMRKPKGDIDEAEEAVAEIALSDRPVVSLTPSADGHWLKLFVEKIVINAVSMDYELLYKLPDGRTQGVPGTVKLDGQESIERDLLLGSESSGKFRYDEGVENGTLTLRFRNEKGKLIGKLSTDFKLLTNVSEITSPDGEFTFDLASTSDDYFVVMGSFGVYEMPDTEIVLGPYGLFSASGDLAGTTNDFKYWNGTSWTTSKASASGLFVK